MTRTLLDGLWRASWQGGLILAALWVFCRVFESRRFLSADRRVWLWRLGYVRLLFGLVCAANIGLPLLPLSKPAQAWYTAPFNAAPPVYVPPAAPVAHESASGVGFASWQTGFAALYLLGVSVCVFRVGQKGWATRQLLLNAEESGAETKAEFAWIAAAYALRRTTRLLRSAGVSIPSYTCGAVLLPTGTAYAPDEMRLIFAHELAHAKRRDLMWKWLGTVTQIAFFFHPLVWMARREEAVCREAAADALALRITQISPSHYGKLLVHLTSAGKQKPPALVLGIVHRGVLVRRLLFLKEDFSMSSKQFAASAALLFGVSALAFVPWSLTNRVVQAQETAPAVSAPPTDAESYAKAKEQAYRLAALSNIRQLALSCVLKVADEKDIFKIGASTLRKDISAYVKNDKIFTSPLDKPGTQSFQFNKTLQNVPQKKLKNAKDTVMLYEGAWGKPLFRYNNTAVIAFADGHAKIITPAQATTLIWQP